MAGVKREFHFLEEDEDEDMLIQMSLEQETDPIPTIEDYEMDYQPEPAEPGTPWPLPFAPLLILAAESSESPLNETTDNKMRYEIDGDEEFMSTDDAGSRRGNKENVIDKASHDSILFYTDSLSESPFDSALKANLRQSGKSHPFESAPVKKTYDRPPSTGSYVTATCPATGKTLYFPRIHKTKTKEPLTEKIKSISHQTDLLGMPLWKIRENANRRAELNRMQRAR